MPNFPQDTMNKLALGGKKKKSVKRVCVYTDTQRTVGEGWGTGHGQDRASQRSNCDILRSDPAEVPQGLCSFQLRS